MEQKFFKNTIEEFLCRASTARHEPALKRALHTQVILLEKTKFSCARGCPFETASRFGMGAHVYFPALHRESIRDSLHMLDMCRPC